jgi:hypothetical protein
VAHRLRRIGLQPDRFGQRQLAACAQQGPPGAQRIADAHDIGGTLAPDQVETAGCVGQGAHVGLQGLDAVRGTRCLGAAAEFLEIRLVQVHGGDPRRRQQRRQIHRLHARPAGDVENPRRRGQRPGQRQRPGRALAIARPLPRQAAMEFEEGGALMRIGKIHDEGYRSESLIRES